MNKIREVSIKISANRTSVGIAEVSLLKPNVVKAFPSKSYFDSSVVTVGEDKVCVL